MKGLRTAATSVYALAALLALAMLNGCESSSPGRAAVDAPPAAIPQIVHQSNGEELLRMDPARVPGATLAEVREVELPSVLEANGQVTFDDRRVSSIVSRVAGRIEQVRVSQWDNVHRGEPIVALYSPDFMTAEAEYLQAKRPRISATRPESPASAGIGGHDEGWRPSASWSCSGWRPEDIARDWCAQPDGLDACANQRHGDRKQGHARRGG